MSFQQTDNISASDIDEDTKEKLKGDTIGDTLYSQTFVIRTLMKLSDLQWTEEVEQDFCFLWDMTIEKDVCKFLFNLNYPALACGAIAKYEEDRIIEVLVGILANILLADCQETTLDDSFVVVILNELLAENSAPVLTQIMRFIEAIGCLMPDKANLLEDSAIEKILFILNNSANNELIIQTIQTLVRLTDQCRLDTRYVTKKLFYAAIEGVDTIFNIQENNFEIEIDLDETSKTVKTFLNLTVNLCEYVEKFNQDPEDGVQVGINNSLRFNVLVCKVLKQFCEEDYLLGGLRDFNYYVSCIRTIFTRPDVTVLANLNNGVLSMVFISLSKILYSLHKTKTDNLETFNLVLEFIACLILITDPNVILINLLKLEYRKGIVVLNSLKENLKTFDFDISQQLKLLFRQFKKV